MRAGLPEYAAMVGPHWVQDVDGIPPGTPARDQSVAREGAITPFQSCALEKDGRARQNEMRLRTKNFMRKDNSYLLGRGPNPRSGFDKNFTEQREPRAMGQSI